MIVHFIGSTKNLEQDLPYLKAVISIIHDNGAVLTRDWLGAAVSGGEELNYENNNSDWHEVHAENLSALARADIVIVDATRYSFQQGFFIAQAIAQKKPILVVARLDSKTHPLFGLMSKTLTLKEYRNQEELKKIVSKFIRQNTISTKDLRFNFFIDRQIYSYLREKSYETGKNKSEIIRELLEQEIENQE